MLEDVTIAISTGAAGNIVAYMLNDQMDALRAQITKMFRHGTGQERATALRTLEHDADALREHNVTQTNLTDQWSNLLLSYLTAHPEAREDIESFAAFPVIVKTVNIGSQKFYGPGSFGAGLRRVPDLPQFHEVCGGEAVIAQVVGTGMPR